MRDSRQRFATELGTGATGVAARPEGELLKLRPLRIDLWDRFGGSMPSGWVRYLFDQCQFPYEVVFAPQLDAGDLREKYYIPGSSLRVAVDSTRPAAWAMEAQTDVMFDDSPVFRLGDDAAAKGVRRVAWFDSAAPLRSGWARGRSSSSAPRSPSARSRTAPSSCSSTGCTTPSRSRHG